VNHNVDVNANLTKSENISFEANCTSGVVEDHEFKCLSGDELIIHCDGSLTGRGRRRCPVTSASANCKSMSVVGSGSGFDLSCELVSFSESSTVCDCAFSFSSKSSPQRRRRSLSEDFQSTSEGGGEGGSVQFSVQSIGKSVMTDFVSTWEVAPTLSVSAVQESVLVLTTMSTIVAAFVMVMLWTVWHDDRERRESENEKSLKLAEDKMLRRYPQRRHRSRSTAYPSLSSQHQSQLSILDESPLCLHVRLLVAEVQRRSEGLSPLVGDRVLLFSGVSQIDESAVSVLEHCDHALRPIRDIQHR
jgi:hypothetical protein